MTHTYDGALTTDKEKVRFYIQDTTRNSGPKPSDGNFSDEELDALVTAEGSWQRAVAAAFETLAAAWRTTPSFSADGGRYNMSDIADGFAVQAQSWRQRYGSSGSAAGSRAVTRVDGYSDDVDNQET